MSHSASLGFCLGLSRSHPQDIAGGHCHGHWTAPLPPFLTTWSASHGPGGPGPVISHQAALLHQELRSDEQKSTLWCEDVFGVWHVGRRALGQPLRGWRSLSSGWPQERARIKGDTKRALQGKQEVDRETRLGCGRSGTRYNAV